MSKKTRRRAGWLALVLALGALVALQGVLERFMEAYVLPTREARWIWAAEVAEVSGPVAFYAVRDFELSQLPEQAILTTTADEEALVFLNAVPIGGSRYLNGQPLRQYEVLEALLAGRNRLVVEVRSVRGVGGLLLRLETVGGEKEAHIVTDGDWQIFRQPEDALFDLTLPLPDGEAPTVWGPATVGRWLVSGRPESIPTIAELRTTQGAVGAQRLRVPDGNRRWQQLGKTDRSSPALGNWVTFDFGREVMAYLALRFPAQVGEDSQPIGLLYLGSQPRILNRSQAERHVVIMPGQRIWLDAKPRRFRYATFVGLTPVSGADVYPVDSARADEIWATSHDTTGAFGLPVGQLGPSLEDVVWRELHRLTSIASGE